MENQGIERAFKERLRVGQLFVGGMALGLIRMLMKAKLLPQESTDPSEWPAITIVAIPLAALSITGAAVATRFLMARWRQEIARGRWPAIASPRWLDYKSTEALKGTPAFDTLRWWSLYLFRTAIFTFAVMFAVGCNNVAYRCEGSTFSLFVAGGLIFGLLASMPTRERIDGWTARQIELLDRLRSASELRSNSVNDTLHQ